MAFPVTPLPVTVEMNLTGTWTDVTSYVYERAPVQIKRGRADEASQAGPSTCTLTLNNRDGRFSPRNPAGALYGQIGRNTGLRVSVDLGPARLLVPAHLADYASAPDTAGLSITGDIDLRVEVTTAWRPTDFVDRELLDKYATAGQRSYSLRLTSAGYLYLVWSSNGTAGQGIVSTVPVLHQTGRQAVRVTLDVDNGAGGKTATFYTASSLTGTWVQLGTPVTTAGTTAIFDGTDPVLLTAPAGGYVHAAEIRQGIAGTVKASPDFGAQTSGATSFADAQGNTWTVHGAASITNRRQRFIGEVSSWPAEWDLSGQDVWVAVEAAGLQRRLGQGTSPAASPLYWMIQRQPSLRAYWPIEDPTGSTVIASALAGGTAMRFRGAPSFAGSSTFAASSSDLALLSLSTLTGTIDTYTATGTVQVGWCMGIPVAGTTNNAVLVRVYTTGSVARYDVVYTTGGGGNVGINAYDSAGTLATTSSTAAGLDGFGQRFLLGLSESGGSVTLSLDMVPIGSTVTSGVAVVTSGTLGSVRSVVVAPGGNLDAVTVGHICVQTEVAAPPNVFDFEGVLIGYAGETADERFRRLCSQWPAVGSYVSAGHSSTLMGGQTVASLLDVLTETVDTDLAVLYEPRDSAAPGLGFRTRESLYDQDARLAAAYADLSGLHPTDDDQQTRNDVTVTRVNGSSARAVLTTGTLSTAAPPAGVGVYDVTYTVNTSTDAVLADHAAFRLHLGTVDATRYPLVRVDLTATPFAGSSTATGAALDLDLGDLLTVAGPPAWLPPDLISLLVQGYTETLAPFDYDFEINCSPGSSFDVGVWDDTARRYSSDGSTLASSATSGATSLSVATPTGPVWSISDGAFDIVIAGERITVGTIIGTTSPQTFIVTRSVNGIVKAHASGETVALFTPAYYAL